MLAVNPGSVSTDRFRHRLAKIMQRTGLDEAQAVEHHRRELDITRFGTPDDVGAWVAFAVSSSGRWLHGTSIDIDGGQVDPLRMSRYDDPVAADEQSICERRRFMGLKVRRVVTGHDEKGRAKVDIEVATNIVRKRPGYESVGAHVIQQDSLAASSS